MIQKTGSRCDLTRQTRAGARLTGKDPHEEAERRRCKSGPARGTVSSSSSSSEARGARLRDKRLGKSARPRLLQIATTMSRSRPWRIVRVCIVCSLKRISRGHPDDPTVIVAVQTRVGTHHYAASVSLRELSKLSVRC